MSMMDSDSQKELPELNPTSTNEPKNEASNEGNEGGVESSRACSENLDLSTVKSPVLARLLPEWCKLPINKAQSNPNPPPELISMEMKGNVFILTDYEKKILNEDRVYIYPARHRNPMPPSTYWSYEAVVEVFIESVENPSDFYIRNAGTEKNLKTLEDAMFEFYHASWKVDPIFKMDEIIMGGFYAVYSWTLNAWYRGKVLYPIFGEPGYDVCVFFVDHGKYENTSLECVKYLRENYIQLPIQAAWASLDVPGIGNVIEWDEESVTKFKTLVEKRRFNAFIRYQDYCLDRHMPKVKVVLTCMVNGEEKIYTLANRLSAKLMLTHENKSEDDKDKRNEDKGQEVQE